MRPVAVFVTNILHSGVGWKGRPFQCLELARAGRVDGVTCREIIDERADKLQSKLSLTAEQVVETVSDLLTFLHLVPITGPLTADPADPDDDRVLECAVAAAATHVVTGDRRRLLPLGRAGERALHELERDLAAVAAIAGAVDHAHASLAELGADLESLVLEVGEEARPRGAGLGAAGLGGAGLVVSGHILGADMVAVHEQARRAGRNWFHRVRSPSCHALREPHLADCFKTPSRKFGLLTTKNTKDAKREKKK